MTPLDPLVLAPAAFLAGILMFLAPCTLPIVPGYLAFIAAVPPEALAREWERRKVIINALAFVLGFSCVFILLGLFAGSVGHILAPWRDTLSRAAGALIILFGLTLLGAVRLPFLQREWHPRLPKFLSVGHPQSSFLIGMLFAIGWSPCIGPILGTVLLFASTSATAVQGGILLTVFSLGFSLPFLITAFFVDRVQGLFARGGGSPTRSRLSARACSSRSAYSCSPATWHRWSPGHSVFLTRCTTGSCRTCSLLY